MATDHTPANRLTNPAQDRPTCRRRAAPTVGRRGLMTAAGVAGVAAMGYAGRGLVMPARAFAASEGEPLVQPEVRASEDGLLETTLTAGIVPVTVAGGTANMSVYEGSFPGPLLRVRPGDTLRVNLVNTLNDVPAGLPDDSPFICQPVTSPGHDPAAHTMTCDTNLHMHGLHVSPDGNADNIFVTVKAGTSFQYEYQIPDDHPAGLYWYHPHLHGTVTNQVFGGMAGPVIIEGDLDELPGVAGVPERVLVLQSTQLTKDGNLLDFIGGTASQKDYLRLINGQLNPTMTMQPGATERWRILNASANTTFLLGLDGHELHQLAKDGNTLNETWTRDAINLAPGERVEVLVQASEAGTYALRTLQIATGFTTQKDAVLATLEVAGAAMTPQPLPVTLLPLEQLADLPDSEIAARRRFTFQFGTPINPPETRFWINFQKFDGNRDDAVVLLNTVEEWTIRNASSNWHPFHIHINDYQVIAVNGKPVPVRSNEDTTGLPPFGEITIRTRFADFPGRWVFHCHILVHEDHGMMGTVRAVE